MNKTKYSLLLIGLLIACLLPAQTLFHSHGTLPAGLVGKPEDSAKKKITAKFNVCCFLFREDSGYLHL
jgi:hypothetical protein